MKIPGSRSLHGLAAVCLLLALDGQPSAQPARPAAVTFPTSGSAEARPLFLRGVTALHLFEYEEANKAFRETHKLDPGFLMPSSSHPLTSHPPPCPHYSPPPPPP